VKTANSPLPNWQFDLTEVSGGVYKVVAVHAAGTRIEMTGTDEKRLIEEAKSAALKMELEIERKASARSRTKGQQV
jgi:hypothetical protein